MSSKEIEKIITNLQLLAVDYYHTMLESVGIDKTETKRIIDLFVSKIDLFESFPEYAERDAFILNELDNEAKEKMQVVLNQINGLPYPQEVIIRFSLMGMNEKQIASILIKEVDSILTYKRLAIQRIKKRLPQIGRSYFKQLADEHLVMNVSDYKDLKRAIELKV